MLSEVTVVSGCKAPLCRQRSIEHVGNRVRRNHGRLGCEVGIAGSGLHLRVSQKLSDDRKRVSGRNRCRGERVPKIMDPDLGQTCAGAHSLPEGLKISQPGTGQRSLHTEQKDVSARQNRP